MLTTLALAASISLSATAGTWAVAPVEAVNVHPGHVAAAQRVLEGHLEALRQPFVALPAGAGDPAASAREKGAAAVLRCSLTRLGQKVKVWMRLEPLDGAPRTVALDAGSPEDLDPVLLRLARQLVSGEPVADARVGEVTERESEVTTRKAAASYFGLTIGGTFATTGTGDEGLGGLGVYWLYDARSFMADIQAGFAVPQTSGGGSWTGASLAALRPFGDRDLTPFLGGGLGFGRLEVGDRAGTGIELFADAGLLFGRTSTVHLRADVKPFVTTFRLTDDAGNGSVGWGARISLGIGY